MLRTGELHPPREGLTPRFDAQVSPNAGGLLQRCLGTSLWPDFHRLVIVNFQDARSGNDSCISGPFREHPLRGVVRGTEAGSGWSPTCPVRESASRATLKLSPPSTATIRLIPAPERAWAARQAGAFCT